MFPGFTRKPVVPIRWVDWRSRVETGVIPHIKMSSLRDLNAVAYRSRILSSRWDWTVRKVQCR